MPMPLASLMNDVLFAALPGSILTASGNQTFSTNQISYIAFDVTVTAVTGGTAPTVQFFIDRLSNDGSTWFNVMSTQSFTTAALNSWDLGPGFAATSPPNGAAHAVFTTQGRIRWVFAGTAPPTSVTYSASVIGR